MSGMPPAAALRPRSLTPLWALPLIFAAPIVAGWLLYLNPEWLPTARSNHGELVTPSRPVPEGLLTRADGTPLAPAALHDAWTLALVTDRCGDECRTRLEALGQVRLAVGANRRLVRRLLVETTSGGAAPEAADLAAAHAAPERLAELVPAPVPGTVAIIDPLGSVMMRYAPDAPQKDILKDLERLLKSYNFV